jgi:hypothetical protein
MWLPAEAEHEKLLAEYERAVEAYGAAVHAAKSSFAAKGSVRFKLRTDAVNVAHAKCEDLHTRLGEARKKARTGRAANVNSAP